MTETKRPSTKLYAISPAALGRPDAVTHQVWERLLYPLINCPELMEQQIAEILSGLSVAVNEWLFNSEQEDRPLTFLVSGFLVPPPHPLFWVRAGVLEVGGTCWTVIFDPSEDFDMMRKTEADSKLFFFSDWLILG